MTSRTCPCSPRGIAFEDFVTDLVFGFRLPCTWFAVRGFEMQEFSSLFEGVEAPRCSNATCHSLHEMLLIALLSVLRGHGAVRAGEGAVFAPFHDAGARHSEPRCLFGPVQRPRSPNGQTHRLTDEPISSDIPPDTTASGPASMYPKTRIPSFNPSRAQRLSGNRGVHCEPVPALILDLVHDLAR